MLPSFHSDLFVISFIGSFTYSLRVASDLTGTVFPLRYRTVRPPSNVSQSRPECSQDTEANPPRSLSPWLGGDRGDQSWGKQFLLKTKEEGGSCAVAVGVVAELSAEAQSP